MRGRIHAPGGRKRDIELLVRSGRLLESGGGGQWAGVFARTLHAAFAVLDWLVVCRDYWSTAGVRARRFASVGPGVSGELRRA